VSLRTDLLDYHLPAHLVAQEPVSPRDASRLLVLHRAGDTIEHRSFTELPAYLAAGDCLVLNNTQVIRARLRGRRPTGGKVELLLVRAVAEDAWEALCRPVSKLRVGTRVTLEGGVEVEIAAAGEAPRRTVRFINVDSVPDFLAAHGHVPLPPYITRADRELDLERYQTVYARVPGAVAAPTAGLHFTSELLAALEAAGVRRSEITLHVGPGTFRPIESDSVDRHRIDPEWYSVTQGARELTARTRAEGRRIVAVGTTTVRVLETLARRGDAETACEGWADLFITPPFEFRSVDAMITNFHLPRSSLLALVAAFAGLERVQKAYSDAIANEYRFYSYGDAMLIL
jgi:S-adenosylmethionine:tRNA ribosyltransferase-isomerase